MIDANTVFRSIAPQTPSTSAKNNSSAITQIIVDGRRLIFTGDAGIDALNHAADQLERCFFPAEISFIQIPHHGSRRIAAGVTRPNTAIASTSKQGEPKHPRKAVLNAFTHRGAKVLATRGNGISHSYKAPNRQGWTSLEPEPYHWEYEEKV